MLQFSGGVKRRVGLVQALLHEPELLIINNPAKGLDPEDAYIYITNYSS